MPDTNEGYVEKPVLPLSQNDGNAFAILGNAMRVARKAKWPKERLDEFLAKARSGDYDNLLQTCMEYFEVE